MGRFCFLVVEEEHDAEGYIPMKMIEDQPGMVKADTTVRLAMPFAQAQTVMDCWNETFGVSETDVAEIIASTVEK